MLPTPGWYGADGSDCTHWLVGCCSSSVSALSRARMLAAESTHPSGAEIRGWVRGETKMTWWQTILSAADSAAAHPGRAGTHASHCPFPSMPRSRCSRVSETFSWAAFHLALPAWPSWRAREPAGAAQVRQPAEAGTDPAVRQRPAERRDSDTDGNSD